VAQIAVETGISPKDLAECDELTFKAILEVFKDRAKAVKNASAGSRS
jgi:hypothetical protein